MIFLEIERSEEKGTEVLDEGLLDQVAGGIMDAATLRHMRDGLEISKTNGDPKDFMKSIKIFADSLVGWIKDSGVEEIPREAVESWLAHSGVFKGHALFIVDPGAKKELLAASRNGKIGSLHFWKQTKQQYTGSETKKVFSGVKNSGDLIKIVRDSEKFIGDMVEAYAKATGGKLSKLAGNHFMGSNGLTALAQIVKSIIRRAK
jgi:hypothetical protein